MIVRAAGWRAAAARAAAAPAAPEALNCQESQKYPKNILKYPKSSKNSRAVGDLIDSRLSRPRGPACTKISSFRTCGRSVPKGAGDRPSSRGPANLAGLTWRASTEPDEAATCGLYLGTLLVDGRLWRPY